HVRLHLLALLQSRARQHLLRCDAGLALVSHPVVADSGRQHHALYRCSNSFLARPLGALSAPAFPLHGRRNYAAPAWAEHSALACESFRRPARLRLALRLASLYLRDPAVRLLGEPPVLDRRPVYPADGRVDAWVHRSLLLAAHEAVFPMGGADPSLYRRAAAAAGHARRAPGRTGRDPPRQGSGLARAEYKADPARQARCHRQYHLVLLPDRIRGSDPAGFRGTRSAFSQRAPARRVHGLVSGPPGARPERAERA